MAVGVGGCVWWWRDSVVVADAELLGRVAVDSGVSVMPATSSRVACGGCWCGLVGVRVCGGLCGW